MKVPGAIFREYDIRGTVGNQLTAEVARAIGQAVATLGWERLGRAPRLAVGRDNRPSGPALTHGLLSGIEAVGGHGVDVGELPTPALYFATHVLNVDGGELGIAFDGDGDRIGAVDDRGRPVMGDQLLVLLGRDLARRMGPGHAVIFDVKCSEVLPRELARAGLVPTMWKTGHSLIKQKMKETRAPLAGEMSGHMFFGGDWYGFDDALFAAARLLRYVADQGGPLSRLLADLPVTVATPELRVDCADDRKFEIAQRAAKHFASKYPLSPLAAVRTPFAQGWGLVRASNTQPVLLLRFEAASESALASYRTEVESWLAAQSPGA